MTAGAIDAESPANGLVANIETPPRGRFYGRPREALPKKGLCGYRGSVCRSKRMASRSPRIQVAGAARPATVPGFTSQVVLPFTFLTSFISDTWEWPQQTRSHSPVQAKA